MASPAQAPEPPPSSERLDSWKEIAAYLKRDERTVRRWEKSEGLPVRRHAHSRQASVYAFKSELDAWWNSGPEEPESAEKLEAASDETPVEIAAEASVSSRPILRRVVGFGLLACAIVVAVIFVWRSRGPVPAVAAHSGPPRVVVLPFRNVSGDAKFQFLGTAFANQISDVLSLSPSLSLPFPDRAAVYAGPEIEMASAMRDLHADVLVAGTYAQEGDRWRLSITIHDGKKPEPSWQQEFMGAQGSVANLAPEIALAVAQALRVEAPDGLRGFYADAGILQSAQLNYLRALSCGSTERPLGLQHLNAALKEAPDYGPAVALKAYYLASVLYMSEKTPTGQQLAEVHDAYAKARGLQAISPVNLANGGLYFMEMGDVPKGVGLLRAAIQINPRLPAARLWLSQAYRYNGLLQESLREADLALEIDPFIQESSTFNTYLYLGRYDEFVAKLPATHTGARNLFYRGLARYLKGDKSSAAQDFTAAFRLEPTLFHARLGYALTLGLEGKQAEGIEVLDELDRRQHPDGELRYKVAQAFAALGDPARSLAALRKTIQAGFVCPACFAQDPLLQTVRAHPQLGGKFQDLLDETRALENNFRNSLENTPRIASF